MCRNAMRFHPEGIEGVRSAILKRRQYLIEDIDRFIDGLPIKYPEVVSELEKYKAFNLKQIESPE